MGGREGEREGEREREKGREEGEEREKGREGERESIIPTDTSGSSTRLCVYEYTPTGTCL